MSIEIAEVDERICAALAARAARATFGYTFQPPELWDVVACWLRRQGAVLKTEHLVFAASICIGLHEVVIEFTDPGDAVLVMTPLFPPLLEAIEGDPAAPTHRRVLRCPLCVESAGSDSQYGFDLDLLSKLLREEQVWIGEEASALGAIRLGDTLF